MKGEEINGLMDAIQTQVDPFYLPPVVTTRKKNRIYIFQFPLWIDAINAGIKPLSFYVGQTDPARGWLVEGEFLVRWSDGDYSKMPERPKLLGYFDVHKDITDHEVRELMAKYGWVKNDNGSPEMIIHPSIKDFSIGVLQVEEELRKLDKYYNNFEQKRGFSPFIQKRKTKNRQEDMHRIPPRSVIYELCNKALTSVSKNDRIYVTKDAHGHFCDYLTSQGYTNLYTDKEYKYFPRDDMAEMLGIHNVKLITEKQRDKMKFTAVIGNPPYNDPNIKAKNLKLWHEFVKKSFELVENGGTVALVTPSSVIGNTGFGKKFLSDVSSKYNMKFINYDTNDQFSGIGVDICSWVVVDESYKGETQVKIKGQNITHNLKDGVPRVGEDAIIHSILEKIAMSSHPRIPLKMGQDIAKEQCDDKGAYEIYVSGKQTKKTNVLPNTGSKLKFVVPFSASYKNRFITTGYIGMLNAWCPIATKDEGDYLSNIFDIPLIQFFVERYKKTSGFTPAIKNGLVPMLESFDNLPEQFELTDEEVEYLRDNNYV